MNSKGSGPFRTYVSALKNPDRPRNILDYLRMACTAAVSQQPAPSLLPSTHSAIR